MRLPGWETRLAGYLQGSQSAPFAWGSNDCALWAAGWVRIATGVDHVTRWKGTYRSEYGARREMLERGFFCVEDIADYHLEEKDIRMANRGDLVLHPMGPLGICNGIHSHFVAEGGLLIVETLACPKAWAV